MSLATRLKDFIAEADFMTLTNHGKITNGNKINKLKLSKDEIFFFWH